MQVNPMLGTYPHFVSSQNESRVTVTKVERLLENRGQGVTCPGILPFWRVWR